MLLPVLEFLNSVLELLVSLLVRYSSQTLGLGLFSFLCPYHFPLVFFSYFNWSSAGRPINLKKKRYLSMSEYMPYICMCHCEPEEGVRSPAAGVTGYRELPRMDAEDWMQVSRKNRRCSLPLHHLPCILWRH